MPMKLELKVNGVTLSAENQGNHKQKCTIMQKSNYPISVYTFLQDDIEMMVLLNKNVPM